jgi:hypothetical protein
VIRYPVSLAELRGRIDAAVPGWRKRAEDKTTAALAKGKLSKSDQIWGEVKEVYYELQAGKCIYCERRLPKLAEGSLESHVEHYRPKNQLRPWPTENHLKRRPAISRYLAAVRSGAEAGYLRLALDPANYGLACATCNSPYKHDYFPIAGEPETDSRDRSTLDETEKPLLLFPLGESGDEPEEIFDFTGVQVQVRPELGSDRRLRADVTIDLLELDTRDDLLQLRALVISALWPRLETLRTTSSDAERARAAGYIGTLTSARSHQVACARAFVALYHADQERARAIAEQIERAPETGLPSLAP